MDTSQTCSWGVTGCHLHQRPESGFPRDVSAAVAEPVFVVGDERKSKKEERRAAAKDSMEDYLEVVTF